jgi:hypothetical protein
MERDDAKHYPVVATLASLGSCPLLQPCPKFAGHQGKEEISMPFRRGGFALTPPSVLLFGISLVLAVLAFLVHYSHMSVPIINSSRVFDVLTIAYIVLMVGVLFRRV